MRNKNNYAVGIRKANQEIIVKLGEYRGMVKNDVIKNLPLIRGVLSFIDSLVLGMKTLTFSASFFEDDETAKPSRSDRLLTKIFKERAEDVVMGITMVMSVIFAVALFMVLPYFISNLLKPYIASNTILTLIEGVIRIGLFIGYVLLITLMKDIQRTFQYHGAEHKCINCIESGLLLNVENVRASSKQHKRCGTSFLLIVMVVSVMFFIFIPAANPVMRIILRLLLLPVVAGVSYELIRIAGNSDSVISNVLSVPGMLLQRLTTVEPDENQIEVAIESLKPCVPEEKGSDEW